MPLMDRVLMDQYAAGLKSQGLVPKGVAAYRRYVERFAEWLDTAPAVEDIAPELIVQYQSVLAETCAPKTVGLHLSAIRSFCRWAVSLRYLPHDPTSGLPWPKYPRPLARALSPDELAGLHAALSVPPQSDRKAQRHWRRNRRAIYVMLYAGLRIGECAALLWAQVDLEAGILTVLDGKGGKDRGVPLSAVLRAELERVPVSLRHGAVCGLKGGQAIQEKSLAHLFERWLPGQGVEGITAHRLRATCATLMRRNGVDLESIRQVLGHSDLTTTQVYLGDDPALIQFAVDAVPAPPSRARLVDG